MSNVERIKHRIEKEQKFDEKLWNTEANQNSQIDKAIHDARNFLYRTIFSIFDEELAKEPQKQPTVNTWVPCSERLPKNQTESWWCTTEYLTCSKDGTIQVLCYSDGWNCSFLNADMDVWRDHEIKSVIAWMPLPSPYTENRKES